MEDAMKVLCIAEKRNDGVYEPMLRHTKALPFTEAEGELFDNEEYKDIVDMFVKIENNGPNEEPVPSFLKDHKETEVILSCYCPINEKAMDELEDLRVIGSIRGGYQHIDVKAATERGIAVFSVPGRNADSVSDLAIGILIAEAREIVRNALSIINTGWADASVKTHYQPDLAYKTVGIVGLGAIGKLMAKKLGRGFDMRVLAYDPYCNKETADSLNVEMVDLETLFKESDFISIHAKATPGTKGMITKDLLSLMKKDAFFINTARASIVDYDALYQLLKEKKIAGAALDVMPVEPIPADDPFLKLDNVTITGHLAGNSSDSINNSPRLLLKEIMDVINGVSDLGLVNKEVLNDKRFIDWSEKIKKEVKIV